MITAFFPKYSAVIEYGYLVFAPKQPVVVRLMITRKKDDRTIYIVCHLSSAQDRKELKEILAEVLSGKLKFGDEEIKYTWWDSVKEFFKRVFG